MRFYRLFLLAVLVGFAAACHSPVEPKGPDNDPPDPEPSDIRAAAVELSSPSSVSIETSLRGGGLPTPP